MISTKKYIKIFNQSKIAKIDLFKVKEIVVHPKVFREEILLFL